jgi:hypothetical protein
LLCRLKTQKPKIEPLDAFVQSLSDEELARQLIIDSTGQRVLSLMIDMPEIFVQISDPTNPEQYKVITGLCLLVRSPAFHPYLIDFHILV